MAGGEGQAANSSNLRVLVTHADGRQVIGKKYSSSCHDDVTTTFLIHVVTCVSYVDICIQTVETIINDLGLKPNDVEGIKERLRRQGVNAVSVNVKGQTEEEDEKGKGQKVVPPLLISQRAPSAAEKTTTSSISIPEDSFGIIGRLFYTPPKTLEQFIKAIGGSQIDEDPQISLAALGSR